MKKFLQNIVKLKKISCVTRTTKVDNSVLPEPEIFSFIMRFLLENRVFFHLKRISSKFSTPMCTQLRVGVYGATRLLATTWRPSSVFCRPLTFLILISSVTLQPNRKSFIVDIVFNFTMFFKNFFIYCVFLYT
jgi:hypothetical protein